MEPIVLECLLFLIIVEWSNGDILKIRRTSDNFEAFEAELDIIPATKWTPPPPLDEDKFHVDWSIDFHILDAGENVLKLHVIQVAVISIRKSPEGVYSMTIEPVDKYEPIIPYHLPIEETHTHLEEEEVLSWGSFLNTEHIEFVINLPSNV